MGTHNKLCSVSGSYSFVPRAQVPKNTVTPKLRVSPWTWLPHDSALEWEKVFLNVLVSAKVCLVKNKVCVHWNAVQVHHSATVFKLTTLCTERIPNNVWIIWVKKFGTCYLLKLDLICVQYLPNTLFYSTNSVPGIVRCALQISMPLTLTLAHGVSTFTVEEIKEVS